MPDSLARHFEQRRPLLEHVAASLLAELREAIEDGGRHARVAVDVVTAEGFVELAGQLDGENRKPLVEVVPQITGRIQVETIEEVKATEVLIDEILSAISRSWFSQENGLPYLQLDCSIPPQAKPGGWERRTDVPMLFRLIVECRPLPIANQVDQVERLNLGLVGEELPLALIMKGGGIKGLAYAGALEVLWEQYRFNWFVGTSAGAVAAVLLGAGYSPREVEDILHTKDFTDFFDASWCKRLWNLLIHKGMYRAQTLSDWIDTLLAKKLGSQVRVRLSHLPHRVTIYASRRNMSALQFDSVDGDADAAYAVRCSMSIPYVFIPQTDQGFRTYDGGLQHNYPVDVLLRSYPGTPFVSLYLGPEVYEPVRQKWVLSDLLSISTEASDPSTLTKYGDQIVTIDTRPIGTLDFNLSDEEKQFLLACGRAAALKFLAEDQLVCEKAVQARDDLRKKVEQARAVGSRQKAWRRMIWAIGIVLMVAMVFLVRRFW